MINFDFFRPNNFGMAHGISFNLGLWTFHKLLKRQKNFDFTFGCPTYDQKLVTALLESRFLVTRTGLESCSERW